MLSLRSVPGTVTKIITETLIESTVFPHKGREKYILTTSQIKTNKRRLTGSEICRRKWICSTKNVFGGEVSTEESAKKSFYRKCPH